MELVNRVYPILSLADLVLTGIACLRFWLDHSAYILEAAALRERTNAMQTRYEHDLKELDKLQKTNVYSQSSFHCSPAARWRDTLTVKFSLLADDAFCIGQEAGFGTINGLRLGRLPNNPVSGSLFPQCVESRGLHGRARD